MVDKIQIANAPSVVNGIFIIPWIYLDNTGWATKIGTPSTQQSNVVEGSQF